MTFKEKLVILRKSKGLTQDEFASAVGVSRQAVYKWESGQSYPEVPKLLEMKLLFTISIDELLDDNYDIPLPEKKKRKRAAKETTPKATPTVKPAPKAEPAAKPAPKAESASAPKAEPIVKPVAPVAPVVQPAAPKAEPIKPVAPVVAPVTQPEPKAEPVVKPAAPTAQPAPAPKAEPAPAPAPKIDKVPTPEELTSISLDDLSAADEQENEKKGSFFGRIFGRR